MKLEKTEKLLQKMMSDKDFDSYAVTVFKDKEKCFPAMPAFKVCPKFSL